MGWSLISPHPPTHTHTHTHTCACDAHAHTRTQNQLDVARYSHIPLGNIPHNPSPFIADVSYARYLTRHNHVLWASPLDQPDLGGK